MEGIVLFLALGLLGIVAMRLTTDVTIYAASWIGMIFERD